MVYLWTSGQRVSIMIGTTMTIIDENQNALTSLTKALKVPSNSSAESPYYRVT